MCLLPLLYFGIIITTVTGLSNCSYENHTKLRRDVIDKRVACHTPTCRELAQDIEHDMNKSVDPCTDFYEYVCGNWEIGKSVDRLALDPIEYTTYRRIHELLVEESKYDELPFIKKAKQFHRSCMDEGAIEKIGLKSIRYTLKKSSGWPILMSLEEWYSQSYSWLDVNVMNYRYFGFSSFFSLAYRQDVYDKNCKIILIEPFITSPIDETLEDDLYRSMYTDLMIKVVHAFVEDERLNISMTKLKEDVERLTKFHIHFRKIIQDEKQMKNASRMTISELQAFYDGVDPLQKFRKINWLNMIQTIFKDLNVSINASQLVIIHEDFLSKFAHLIDLAPISLIVNYIQWNMVTQLIPQLNRRIRNIEFGYNSRYDVIGQEKRWLTCVKSFPMHNIASYIFIKRHISADTLKAISKMVDEIKEAMEKHILLSSWMSNSTKNHFINKIDNVSVQIGHPKWYDNQTGLFNLYEKLKFNENYLENWLEFRRYKVGRTLIDDFDIREGASKSTDVWPIYPTTVKALYNDERNMIIIPAALIQSPYFSSPYVPIAVNYGAVGSIIGHVLAQSCQWNKIGKSKDDNSSAVIANIMDRMTLTGRSGCYIVGYDTYMQGVTDRHGNPFQNGKEIVEENIADFIGIKAAFAAFQKRMEREVPQPKLPTFLNVTDQELFFLSLANPMCASASRFYVTDFVHTFVHNPRKFRISGTLANVESFAEAFKCPLESPMNPKAKCVIWD